MLNVPIKQNISSVWLYKCMMGGGGERQMIPRQIKNITTANFWQGWYKTFSPVSIFASCNKFSSRNIDQSRNLDFVFLRFANFDKSQETPCVCLGTGPLWSETLLCFESNQSLDTSGSPQHHPQGDNSKEKLLHFWIKDADIYIFLCIRLQLRISGYCFRLRPRAQIEELNFPGQLINKRENIRSIVKAGGVNIWCGAMQIKHTRDEIELFFHKIKYYPWCLLS